jgi:DNA-binding CsgD family transcriptional regulator
MRGAYKIPAPMAFHGFGPHDVAGRRHDELGERMLDLRTELGELAAIRRPDEVVAVLQRHALAFDHLNVYGAYRLPQRPSDYRNGYLLGRTAFIHPRARAHFNKHIATARERGPNILARMTWVRRSPFTTTECMRLTRPNEGERWVFNLLRAHGIRDMFYCPVDDWIVVFWSPKVLRLSLTDRGHLYSLALQATMRLDEIVDLPKKDYVRLSTREVAVLHYLSNGASDAVIAQSLGIGEGTIRTYVLRAMSKLGVKTREHAVAEALRRLLVK